MILHLLLAAFLVVTVHAEEAAPPPVIDRSEPDHLVPVDPYPGEWRASYAGQLRSRLKLEARFFARMFVRPSFEPEYVVRLHGSEGKYDINTAREFFLTYAVADQNIYYAMPENNDAKKQKEVKIATITVEFPKALAMRIDELWQKMLRQVRYDEGGGGDDGTTFEFGGQWGRYGETWSPKQLKSPLLFVELGESLISYCKAKPAERIAAADKIEEKAAQLETYMNERTK